MATWLIVLLILVGVMLLIGLVVVCIYNSLVRNRIRVEESFSTMDVYLKKRWDLIPNLVETVKGYAKHEKETFEKVVELRNLSYNNMNIDEKIKANRELSAGISKLIAIAENYPELKANSNFQNLSNQLASIENDIANSRKYYNGCVANFNMKVKSFPSNIVARMFHFETFKMYEIDNIEHRNNVKVEF